MIAVCEGLITLCEWFNTCLLQFKQDFRWLLVTQPNRFIIAYDAESVEQKSINLGLNWRVLYFTHIIRVNKASWSRVNCLKGGICFSGEETALFQPAKIRASSFAYLQSRKLHGDTCTRKEQPLVAQNKGINRGSWKIDRYFNTNPSNWRNWVFLAGGYFEEIDCCRS